MSQAAILFFHKDHPLHIQGVNSGAENATLWLARALAAMGRRVVVCGDLPEGEQKKDGVEYWDFGKNYDVGGVLKRARTLGQYHLISACRGQPILESRNESSCLSRIFIAHDPSSGAAGVKPAILGRVSDALVCVSEAQKGLFVQGGAESGRVTVIPNGADQELFAVGAPEQREPQRIIFIGALVSHKGIDILLHAFLDLLNKYPKAVLDVYGSSQLWGEPPMFNQDEIQAKVPRIKFHGAVSQTEVAEALKKAAACVIPSRWFDSFPLTAVEAQVAGCPVIAFDVGGIREIVRHNETGILLPEVSEDALRDTLDKYLASPETMLRMSKRSLEVNRPFFTWERAAKSVLELCAKNEPSVRNSENVSTPLGLFTTWNQECGLATYGRYLASQFSSNELVILAEETKRPRTQSDEENVVRCWTRADEMARSGGEPYRKLEETITQENIKLLHLNCHYRFLKFPEFKTFSDKVRGNGTKIVAHLHSVFTTDKELSALLACVDSVIVHTPENRLEAIASGASPASTVVISHGVHIREKEAGETTTSLRTKLGLPTDKKLLVSFGFVQPHKGMEALLEAVIHLRSRGTPVHGVIVGRTMADDPHSAQYLAGLQELVKQHKLESDISFVSTFVDDKLVGDYLAAADLVIMNYRSQHYEASGACSLALGAGAVVASSIAPPFAAFGDAVWHMTSGYPPALSADLILNNAELFNTLKRQAQQYATQNSWPSIKQKLVEIYSDLGCRISSRAENLKKKEVEEVTKKKETAVTTQNNTPGKKLRVLMQNRSTTFTHRGGDTIVIERLAQGLQDRGVDVTVDLQGAANPKDYDLVHLYNFALPDMVKIFAERCVQAGTPYVVTTLCEDVPRFHTQSHAVANTLIEYVARGQDRTWLDSNWPDLSTVKGVPAFNNEWSARNAAALFPNGKEEAAAILRNHPGLANLVNIPLGHEIGSTEGAEMFVREYGVQDFILCVGRLESRKNQLMLLAALEESDLPVVLAAGGFSYQPDFEASVKNFKRRGKTLILDRLSPEMLASAYAAARVHVLPSWYELPGLVSLEAASRGKNVVVTRYGTASDYFGDKAFYCNPAELDSIYTAVMSAYYSPLKSGLRETASKYTWDNAVAETLQAYQQVLSISKQSAATITTTAATTTVEARTTGASPVYDMTSTATDFQEQVEKGEMAARNGNYKDAHRYLSMAENLDPQSVRVLKARGAVFLAESKVPEAKAYFDRALIFSPEDSKVLCGRGMCEVKVGNEAGALPYFSKAVTASPDSATAIRQLTQAAMAAKQFGEAERAVKSYLALKPEDTGMRVMFSEALMTTGRTDDAREQVMAALRLEPENEIARTLMTKLSAETPQTTKTTVAQPSSMQTTPQPQQETPPKGLGPLAELSKMISGWKVPVATAETTATTTPTASDTTNKTEEKPRDETATLEATRTTSETEASKPWRGTVRQDNSVAIDTFFIEAEEAKREKRFEDVLKKCKTILGYPGITPMQKARAESLQAEILVVEGRLDEAAAEYERILTEVPGCTRALCGKGALEAHSGNWSGAAKCFDEALKGRQDVDIALSGLAMCAQQEGRIEDAWKLFMQALQVNQENYRAILGVIQLGYKLSRLNEIESVLRTFLEIHPANIEMLYSLAGVLFAQRRMMEANAQLDTILLFESEHKLALELKRVIEDAEKDQVTVVGQ